MMQDYHRHGVTRRLGKGLADRLSWAAEELGTSPQQAPFDSIWRQVELHLSRIARLLDDGAIDPFAQVRTSYGEAELVPSDRQVRLGVYPVNGNPLHWGHLLCALEAIAEQRLDKVVFVVQGVDPRKRRISAATQFHRHEMARGVIEVLDPLAEYSSIGLGTELVGEDNVFALLRLNPHQKITATYMVGADHYGLVDGHGNPDTIPRIEENISGCRFGFDARVHTVRVLFIERGERPAAVPTSLDVAFLPAVLDASSTAVRAGDLAFAPLEVLQYMKTHESYVRQLDEPLAAPPIMAAPQTAVPGPVAA